MEALTARDLGPAVALEPVAIAVALADAAFDAWLEVEGRGDRHDKVGMGAGGNPTSKADAALEKAILDKAEEPTGPGLWFMDSSSAAAEMVTLCAAAGFTVLDTRPVRERIGR